jgi:hypothetical protein
MGFAPYPQKYPHCGYAVNRRRWTSLDARMSIFAYFLGVFRRLRTFLEGVWCAKRIRTPDPRITNSEIFGVSHINVCLTNAKRGLSLWSAANLCLWWYKSGYSESVGCGFLIADTRSFAAATARHKLHLPAAVRLSVAKPRFLTPPFPDD